MPVPAVHEAGGGEVAVRDLTPQLCIRASRPPAGANPSQAGPSSGRPVLRPARTRVPKRGCADRRT